MARPVSKLNLNLNIVYKNNLGFTFTILKYNHANNVIVKFSNTGHEKLTTITHVRRGAVKDEMEPSIYGVGIVGLGRYKCTVNREKTPQYKCWASMLHRCYYPKFLDRFPTYRECYVCKEWLTFQNFAMWFDLNFPRDGMKYDLDKDIKIDENKVYSPEACSFVSPIKNKQKAFAKNYKLKSPSGEIVLIYNMSKFCRDNNLHGSAVHKVMKGTISQTGGWTKA